MVTKEELTPGTRIRFLPEGSEDEPGEYAVGLVVEPQADEPQDYKDDYLFVKREDGVLGGGNVGEWRIALSEWDTSNITIVSQTAWTFPKGQPAHRMGLDPETIDPQAYRDFMRSL